MKLHIHFIFDAFQHSLDLSWKAMDKSQEKKIEIESNENEQWMRIM